MGSRRPTVLDVAKAAGVGASTVSRCLRGGRYVSPHVRERILRAVARIGYEPDEVARSLRSGRTYSIGIVFPHISNAFFSSCVQAIENEATRLGCSVVLLTHQEDPERQSMQLGALRRFRTGGVILTPAPGSDPDRLRKELGGVPVVALDRPLSRDVDSVTLRNRHAAETATRHLLEHGYREIACVTANPEIYTFRRRIEGFRSVMAQAGRRSRLILAGDYHSLTDAVRTALLQPHPPDALLSLSNMATFTVVNAIQSVKGRKTAVIGFDDVNFATLVHPSLSVVQQPTDLLAHSSTSLLFERLGDAAVSTRKAQAISCPAQMVLRESCGCKSSTGRTGRP